MRALAPRTVSAPDGRRLALRFEALGGTWHVAVDAGPETAGLDLPEALALATGDVPDAHWILALEREVDPEYSRSRHAGGTRRSSHSTTR